jgi:phosphoglycerate kinase
MNPEVASCGPTTDPGAGLPHLEDLPDVAGRRVLVRADFNVPLTGGRDGRAAEVADDFRIRAALPTLEWLASRGASVTACTHLGRPKGRVDLRYDVAPVRERLSELAPGVALLENLRFHPGEESGDTEFARQLVTGFDAYVNDAFGCCHRAHASIVGPPALLPSAAGRLLQQEVEAFGRLLNDPGRPFVAIVGGAKVADKLAVLQSLLDRVDRLIVGGGMAYTFLSVLGHPVGRSLIDPSSLEACRSLIDSAGDRLLLPLDAVALEPGADVTPGSQSAGKIDVVGLDIPEGWKAADIGPATSRAFAEALADAKTVFWNGPLGAFEDARFAAGTFAVGEAMTESSAFTVIGGGDTVAAFDGFGLAAQVSFVSTGGGASLELLEYGDLPGLRALRQAANAPSPSTRTGG